MKRDGWPMKARKMLNFSAMSGHFLDTRAQNVCPGWPVYEVKQPHEKWACDFHDDAPPLSFQLQVAEVIF